MSNLCRNPRCIEGLEGSVVPLCPSCRLALSIGLSSGVAIAGLAGMALAILRARGWL